MPSINLALFVQVVRVVLLKSRNSCLKLFNRLSVGGELGGGVLVEGAGLEELAVGLALAVADGLVAGLVFLVVADFLGVMGAPILI